MLGVIEECYRTVDDAPIQTPPHVKDLLIATFEQGAEVDKMLFRAKDAARDRLRSIWFISNHQDDLTSAVAILRDKVGLMRDACSE